MTKILTGKEVAAAITENIEKRSAALIEKGKTPVLGILRVGENPSDMAYERGALKRAEKTGVQVKKTVLPETATTEQVLTEVEKFNSDDSVDGVLIYRPMPSHIDDDLVRNALAPEKDIDGIGNGAMAGVYSGRDIGYSPCTAEACIEILKYYNIPIKGRKAVIIGRSLVIGRPVAMMLMKEHATITICHTRTEDPAKEAAQADILIAAAGKAGVVDRNYMHPGQYIIDVGINVDENGNMCGDADFKAGEGVVSGITPVPGGVGGVTTSVLMKHVVEAAEKKAAQL